MSVHSTSGISILDYIGGRGRVDLDLNKLGAHSGIGLFDVHGGRPPVRKGQKLKMLKQSLPHPF